MTTSVPVGKPAIQILGHVSRQSVASPPKIVSAPSSARYQPPAALRDVIKMRIVPVRENAPMKQGCVYKPSPANALYATIVTSRLSAPSCPTPLKVSARRPVPMKPVRKHKFAVLMAYALNRMCAAMTKVAWGIDTALKRSDVPIHVRAMTSVRVGVGVLTAGVLKDNHAWKRPIAMRGEPA